MTGFLVTCESNAEKRCVKECFNILNQALESVYPDIIEQIPVILEEAKLSAAPNKKQKTEDKEEEKVPEKKEPV